MTELILYSTGCPRCKQLEKKLKEKGIEYTEVTDVDKMIEIGLVEVPVLEVNGEKLDYQRALHWVNGV